MCTTGCGIPEADLPSNPLPLPLLIKLVAVMAKVLINSGCLERLKKLTQASGTKADDALLDFLSQLLRIVKDL